MAIFDSHSYAFVLGEALDEEKESVLGLYAMALKSPLPLALAVRSLPLFFVSELAAKRRKILPGYCIMPAPGKKFYLQ